MRVAAALSVALLLNAIGLAPGVHAHGPEHDASDCPVCALQAQSAWTPAAAEPGPCLGRSPLAAPESPRSPVLAQHLQLPAGRGPPVAS